MRAKDASPWWFVVLIVAGLAVIVTALFSSGGDPTAQIEVRGGGAPAYLILSIGGIMAVGGIIGAAWSRE